MSARGRWHGLQQFLIAEQGQGPVDGVRLEGIEEARPTEAVLKAIEGAAAIMIGPSNPVISIGPILAVPGLREALLASTAPVLAVSPIVGGEVLKGPTEAMMEAAGAPVNAAGIAQLYEGLIGGLVTDEDCAIEGIEVTTAPTLMDSSQRRRDLARTALSAADALSL
uniref:Unannotated protein n=1 Tax=freshwater metagenome TaxID=449393 RepID=A0A6J5ZGN3_9ZZZZ